MARKSTRVLRFEIDWTASLGFRIDRSAETTSKRERTALTQLLYQLRANGQVEVLRRFAAGAIPIALLKQARRQGRLSSDTLLADLAMLERLWHSEASCPVTAGTARDHGPECIGAFDRLLPALAKGTTRKRYKTSLRKLARVAGDMLPPDAVIQDLTTLDWAQLQACWPGSGSDWNHLRRAISRFLSVLFGHPYHQNRLAIMGRIPIAEEVERTPDVTVDQFWDIVRVTPEHARASYVVLACTMMRLGEYLRCTEAHLIPGRHAVRVPGTKTKASSRIVEVGEEAWQWIVAGIPSPLGERWLRLHWQRACVELGFAHYEPLVDAGGQPVMVTRVERVRVPGKRARERREVLVQASRYMGLRLHDLRHVGAQVALDEGAADSHVQDALGHSSSRMTRRYTRRQNAAVAGRATAAALFTDRRVG